RECKDQILRNFLMGMQIKLRGKNESESDEPEESVYDLTYQSTSTE
ncbi:MAG: hypothetical protein ACI9WR_000833, partial [Paracoccaceae bacterium]